MSDAPEHLALKKAITAAGSISRLADALGITSQAISQWDVVPWSRAPQVSQVTGIPLDELRPDMFRASAPGAAA